MDFKPDYTPLQMFEMGIFGGCYFKVQTKLPIEFIKDSKHVLHGDREDFKLNKYKVDCGSSLEWWLDKNLIHHDDPNGWVEWYIKYYYGRRHEDDDRQIARFNAFKSRHGGMIKKYPKSAKTQQNLLQWAIDYKLILNQ